MINDLKAQAMSLCQGDITQYNELYLSSVEIYLRKFEHYIKTNSDGKGTT